MWGILEKITTQVVNYSSTPGQVWYILVFGYRLVVITSLGGSVYGDEQGAFTCSEKQAGCTNMCYNQFAKISHLRFWAFQLIAISTPTIFFHFYSIHVQSQIEKIKETEKAIREQQSLETGETIADPARTFDKKMEKDFCKLTKRRNQVGKYKIKEVYRGSEKKEIPQSRRIKIFWIVSLVIRLVVEILFTYFGIQLFDIHDDGAHEGGIATFLWMRVPAFYKCRSNGDNEIVIACSQHMSGSLQEDGSYLNEGHVPCWVSRPYEKTVFLRYMNILSFICMILTVVEIVQFFIRQFTNKKPNQRPRNFDQEQAMHLEPPSFDTVMKRTSAPYGNERTMYKPLNEVAATQPAGSLFECVSVEGALELEKRDMKKGRKKSRDRVAADAPPYESDFSFVSEAPKKTART